MVVITIIFLAIFIWLIKITVEVIRMIRSGDYVETDDKTFK